MYADGMSDLMMMIIMVINIMYGTMIQPGIPRGPSGGGIKLGK